MFFIHIDPAIVKTEETEPEETEPEEFADQSEIPQKRFPQWEFHHLIDIPYAACKKYADWKRRNGV